VTGTVVVRVAPEKAPVLVDGPALLAPAAMDIARTWTIYSRNNEPFDVRVHYRLAHGACDTGGPIVHVDLPGRIEITACAPSR
jgi:hypothetical protein